MKRIIIVIYSCIIITVLFLSGKNAPLTEQKNFVDYDYWEIYYNDSLLTKSSTALIININ